MSKGRSLSEGEMTICERVFAGTISARVLSNVTVFDSLGIGGRPFTAKDFGLGRYEIYIGWKAFDPQEVTQKAYKGVFVHEMTHVWQAEQGWGIGAVWLSSIICQCQRQGNAYLYGEGNLGRKGWDDFGKEEQAQIVQDWFVGGMKGGDPRFPYIKHHIRAGRVGYVGDGPEA